MSDKHIIACHCCDLIQDLTEVEAGQKAHCRRCGHLLMKAPPNALEKAIAFACCALMFLILSLPFPFLAFQAQGQEHQVTLMQSGFDLLTLGFPVLALLLALFIILVPALLLSAYLVVLIPLYYKRPAPYLKSVARILF